VAHTHKEGRAVKAEGGGEGGEGDERAENGGDGGSAPSRPSGPPCFSRVLAVTGSGYAHSPVNEGTPGSRRLAAHLSLSSPPCALQQQQQQPVTTPPTTMGAVPAPRLRPPVRTDTPSLPPPSLRPTDRARACSRPVAAAAYTCLSPRFSLKLPVRPPNRAEAD